MVDSILGFLLVAFSSSHPPMYIWVCACILKWPQFSCSVRPHCHQSSQDLFFQEGSWSFPVSTHHRISFLLCRVLFGGGCSSWLGQVDLCPSIPTLLMIGWCLLCSWGFQKKVCGSGTSPWSCFLHGQSSYTWWYLVLKTVSPGKHSMGPNSGFQVGTQSSYNCTHDLFGLCLVS